MAVEAWRWTGRRIWGAVLPFVMLVAGFLLMRLGGGNGPLTWCGMVVGAVGAVVVMGFWSDFANIDGAAKVRLSPFAWVVRIVSA
ncbi:hypothetical protein ACH347_18490 [Saccharopolyspora sp. 5N102]|uniref:hypothetical protein n=1 Tax=Saccharopolyspora sp. 5N102 TaxID=3375155 RepID=UPI00378AD5C7